MASTDWRRIEEKETDPCRYPIHRLADSVVDDAFRKTLIESALEGHEADGLALCEVRPGRLKYLHVWARPVMNNQGEVIACSLSMVDQTASNAIREMSLQHQMELIAQAIQRAGYDRARLYRVSEHGERIIGVVEAGGGTHVDFKGYEIDIASANYLQVTIAERKPRLLPTDEADDIAQAELGKTTDFVIFPLFDQDRFIGLLEVDRELNHREHPMSQEDIHRLKPYAEEAKRVLLEAPRMGEQRESSIPDLADVWAQIDRCTNPNEAMHIILTAALKLTGCDAAHIRVCQGSDAIMVAHVGEYPKHRPKILPWDSMYWSVRVMRTRQPIIVHDVNKLPRELFKERETWTKEAQEAFACANAFAIFPLTFGDVLGALVVLPPNVDHFTEERCGLLQYLACLAATAWVDLSRAQNRQGAAQREVAFATVHNLRQPTTALRSALQRILKKHTKGALTVEYAVEATHDALKYLRRSESIITDVLRYLKPLEIRKRVARLRTIVELTADEFMGAQEQIKVVLNIPPEVAVRVDVESLRQMFEELLSNASRAMDGCRRIRP